jgi:hypothetical protein
MNLDRLHYRKFGAKNDKYSLEHRKLSMPVDACMNSSLKSINAYSFQSGPDGQ